MASYTCHFSELKRMTLYSCVLLPSLVILRLNHVIMKCQRKGIEVFHIKFCKYLLRIGKRSVNNIFPPTLGGGALPTYMCYINSLRDPTFSDLQKVLRFPHPFFKEKYYQDSPFQRKLYYDPLLVLNPIELFHNKFCKYLLRIGNKSVNNIPLWLGGALPTYGCYIGSPRDTTFSDLPKF